MRVRLRCPSIPRISRPNRKVMGVRLDGSRSIERSVSSRNQGPFTLEMNGSDSLTYSVPGISWALWPARARHTRA